MDLAKYGAYGKRLFSHWTELASLNTSIENRAFQKLDRLHWEQITPKHTQANLLLNNNQLILIHIPNSQQKLC